MRVSIDLDLEGLEEALADALPLPSGTRLDGIDCCRDRLEIALRAPLGRRFVLTARILDRPRERILHDWNLAGAGILRGMILDAIRRRISELEGTWSGLRVWGEAEGDRLHLAWPAEGGR
ncbi:MAG: hypothetical protein D6702_04765 [Planctomycetota bacterium]|nr:MAG: hypothetical protein D6702_04765 [Planctomycetota bacterium]